MKVFLCKRYYRVLVTLIKRGWSINPFIDDITRTLFEFLIAVELIEKLSGGQSRRHKLILRLTTSHEGYENSDRKEGGNGRKHLDSLIDRTPRRPDAVHAFMRVSRSLTCSFIEENVSLTMGHSSSICIQFLPRDKFYHRLSRIFLFLILLYINKNSIKEKLG